jgi:hypothetical protein
MVSGERLRELGWEKMLRTSCGEAREAVGEEARTFR